VGVAVDETLVERRVAEILERDAADVLIVKPMVLGGPGDAHTIATRARDAGVDPVVTTTVDGVVARTAAVHVAAAIPDVAPCGLATAELLAEDLGPDPAPVDDAVFPFRSPGTRNRSGGGRAVTLPDPTEWPVDEPVTYPMPDLLGVRAESSPDAVALVDAGIRRHVELRRIRPTRIGPSRCPPVQLRPGPGRPVRVPVLTPASPSPNCTSRRPAPGQLPFY